MDPATQVLLQDLVRKEGRSLMQYVSESFPWTTAKNDHVLPVLMQIVKEEQDGAAMVVRLLMRRKLRPPYLGAYPMSFTNINYIALEHLLPYLVDFEKRRIADLEGEVGRIGDDEARTLVHSLLEMKQRHLKLLAGVAGPSV